MKKLLLLLVVFLALNIAGNTKAHAITFMDAGAPEPHSAWAAYVGTYSDVSIPVVTSLSSLDLPYGETLAFSSSLQRLQVPMSWATWSYGHTPTVLYSGGYTSITGSFSSPVSAFGLEMEPNPFSVYAMTLTLSDGSIITQDVSGYSGAKFFGWADEAVSSMTISSAADFAIGRMVQGETTAPIPEPSSMMLLGMGVLGLLGFRRKIS